MAGNLSATLTSYRRSRSNRVWFIAWCVTVIFNIAALTCGFILDNLTGLSGGWRLFLLLVWLTGNLLIFIRLKHQLKLNRLTDREAAVELESKFEIRDNSLVNAVCFLTDKSVSVPFRQAFAAQADENCGRIVIPGLWHHPWCRRVALVMLVTLGVSLAYYIPCYRYAGNAFMRYISPWSQLASLNFTQFTVEPGDAEIIEGGELTVQAVAERDGQALHNLKIRVKNDGAPLLYNMELTNGRASFVLKNLNAPLTYAVCSGNDASREFKVRVKPKPRFTGVGVTVTPPEYTRMKSIVYGAESREISAPAGSSITIKASAPVGMTAGGRSAEDKNELTLPYSFVLQKNGSFRAFIRDSGGVIYEEVWGCEFKVLADQPPQVRFLNRDLNIEAGAGQSVPLHFAADDDYGISRLLVVAGSNGNKKVLKEFCYDDQPQKKINEVFMLKINPAQFPVDSSVEINVIAVDNHMPSQNGMTGTPITIHVVDMVKKLRESLGKGQGDKMYELLFQALNRQQAARGWLAERVKQFRKPEGWTVVEDQKTVAALLVKAEIAADALVKDKKLQQKFVTALAEIRKNNAEPLAAKTRELMNNRKQLDVKLELNTIMLEQTTIIEALQKLLGGLAVAREQDIKKQEIAKDEVKDKEFFAKLEQVKDKVKEFMKEQRKIIEQTEALDPKKTDDWSDKEEKMLGDMAAREAEWAQFFKAAFNDLSKLQNQDFSNSVMADEFTEMYEELQKSGKALEKKKIEIATLAENTAMDFSTSVAANLERWLSDAKDYIKWNAEEDGKAPDVNLSDLPNELTDIIGDLIESEDDMSEDTEDSTNSFTYDSDEAIGWGVADGNIDSMQAKGITGNVMPNNNEVGGRSGEGRSGKSSGQFVEKEATGKGGRKTPTRLDQTPFEKGSVDDKSKDPQGGVSGGGKQSGVGDEGLVGVTPDQDSDIKQRLAGNQGELKQRATALLRRLNENNLPTGDLRDALYKMKQLEDAGNGGSGVDVRRVKSEMLAALRNARTALDTAVQSEQEKVRTNNRKAFTVKHQQDEKVPAEYDDYVGRYFKALAAEEGE